MATPPEFGQFRQTPPVVYSTFAKFAVFFGIFFLMFICVSIVAQVITDVIPDKRTAILCGSTLQAVFAFMVPSYIIARIESRYAFAQLSLNKAPTLKSLSGVIIGFMVAMPAYNVIIDWNANMHFPESMSALESAMRHAEDAAAAMSETILADSSILGLITGILVVGIITGIGEELFFRAGLQRLLGERMSKHVAIWTAAIIFSIMHFQFFGFVPRMLLGAYFGYLYVWTGTIWVPIFAHAFNNSLVVVMSWLQARGVEVTEIEQIGINGDGWPWLAMVSVVLTILFFYYRNIFFKQRQF